MDIKELGTMTVERETGRGIAPDAGLRARRRLLLMSSVVGMTPLIRRLLPGMAGRRMAFIPTASYAEGYGAMNRMARWWWRALGVDVHVVDVAGERCGRIHDELARADVLYLCGGNTFYLMHCLERSGAARVIRDRVAHGVPFLGESAGAVVAAPSIEYIAPMDAWNGVDGRTCVPGIGLTAYRVVPHVHGLAMGRAAARILHDHDGEPGFVGLGNDQALVVTGTAAKVVTNLAITPLAM